ncbi:MAG: MATE family efflux transporter [Clostridiaceae bacterium]|nr:MATE family efflux transporter [Clostridiaceae bacterium]
MGYIFDNGVTAGKYAKFVSPSVVMMVVMSLYYLLDSIFVARFLEENALAAMNIVYPVQGLCWGISIMMAAGSSALVAINMGEGKLKTARQRFTLICIIALVLGIILAILGVIYLDEIVNFLGTTELLKEDCLAFGYILMLAVPISFLSIIIEYFVRIDGHPGFTLFLYIINGAVHLALDILFMAYWGWGIEAAAWATLFGQGSIVVIGGIYFIRNQIKNSNIKFAIPKMDWRYVGHSFANGSSEMVTESSVAITTILYNGVMLSLVGEIGVAALTIVQNAHYFLISVHLGYIAGVAPLISYYFGAKEYSKVNVFLSYSKKFISTSSIIIAVLAFLFANSIAGVFVSSESEVYHLAASGLKIISVAFLFTGLNVFGSGFFTAYGNGLVSALISFCRGLIMVIIGLLFLPKLFGVSGVWMVFGFAELATIGITVIMLRTFKNRYHYSFSNLT